MSTLPAANDSNNYLRVSPRDGRTSPSTRGRSRSVSVTPSVRSSKSRITVVEDYAELDDGQGVPGFYKKTTTEVYAPKYTWFEHLLGVLGFNVSKRKKPFVEVKKEKIMMPPGHEVKEIPVDDNTSPWILPVHVYSSRKDTNRHQVTKDAKCTIDTGNHQGNIVSRDFVVNVLEFPEANFKPLNAKEKQGAIGITGNRFVPEAAIYLTWYHSKSTRVFYNMRFLITPNPHCDLIIGAYSIQANQLLDVPNLIARGDGGPDGHLGKTVVIPGVQDTKKKELEDEKYTASSQVNDLKSKLKKAKKDGDDTKEVEEELAAAEKQLDAAKQALEDYTVDVESQNLPGPSAGNRAATNGSATSTGIDNQAVKPKKKGSWSLRPRGPQGVP